jgi:microcystin-dependent protein
VQNGIPTGVIVMWSGAIVNIPSGWLLCDGGNGTPDLRDRFIVGAGSAYAVGATGGSANAIVVSHTHTATTTATDSGHTHSSQGNGAPNGGGAGVAYVSATGNQPGYATTTGFASISASTTVNSTGSSGTNANLPPYYALAYIMKA